MYTLNLHNAICQLYLNKVGKKEKGKIEFGTYEVCEDIQCINPLIIIKN